MKYRIVKKTMRNGLSNYHIQIKKLFFWRDFLFYYSSLDSANNMMNRLIEMDIEEYNSKVIKKEIVKNEKIPFIII